MSYPNAAKDVIISQTTAYPSILQDEERQSNPISISESKNRKTRARHSRGPKIIEHNAAHQLFNLYFTLLPLTLLNIRTSDVMTKLHIGEYQSV